jgi:porphobilinogen synthase
MTFPFTRARRLRRTPQLRSLVRETRIVPSQLIKPLFIVPGKNVEREVSSMPGQFHYSVDRLGDVVKRSRDLGISSVLLFGIPKSKDEIGSSSWDNDGVVQRAIGEIKEASSEITVITDLCFCEYTSHGHCGVMENGELVNDKTLSNLLLQALSHAKSGADVIAPSGMLDGAIGALRHGLDENNFQQIVLMAYSVKFASGFYGPFREAVESTPEYGDRKGYQMDPANFREAMREAAMDIEEGADIIMVKPAVAYLDVIHALRQQHDVPIAAYHVSGEYSMIQAAASKGWIDGKRVMLETLTAIRRAGADTIITYFADEYAAIYQRGELE